MSADVAQFGKQEIRNPKVAGSSPLCGTIFFSNNVRLLAYNPLYSIRNIRVGSLYYVTVTR